MRRLTGCEKLSMCFRLATVPSMSTEKGLEQQLGGLDAGWKAC